MIRQPIIEKIQTWLNETYSGSAGYNPIAVTGLPGWDTTNAMLIAYQIEDGISVGTINQETSKGIYDFTGENFSPISADTDFSIKSNQNKFMILQGAFYVKGINPGGFAPIYNSQFASAVSTLQSNAGIAATGVADLLVVKGLLSMDSFTVLPQYGGVEAIAEIQRAMNAQYASDMGALIPCDGVYGRELNKALIYALQIREGLSVSAANEANGYFGDKTQSYCPTLTVGETSDFVTLLQYALYCNGYTGVSFTGTYDAATESAVASFGRSMDINTNYGQEADLNVWMGLLLSSGNPKRSVSGCDAAQVLSLEDAQILKQNGYDIVGRYLTGDFATSVWELTNILNAGLNVFPIYETGSYKPSYFTTAQGASDAIAAVEACRRLGIPEGTIIYFTVDYDMEGYQIQNLVLPYFETIKNKFNDAQLQYNIGIYGSRNICKEVIDAGYAQLAFVDGASTGYSGNMGYPMPEQWAFNQIKEGVDIDGVQVDNDQVSGRDMGFSYLILGGNISVINHMSKQLADINSSASIEAFREKLVTFLAEQIISIKTPPIKSFSTDRKWLVKDLVYTRFEGGIKGQGGSGSFITIYLDKHNSLDIMADGVGINIEWLVDNVLIKDLIKELLEQLNRTIKSAIFAESIEVLDNIVSLEFYPKYRESIDEENPNKGTKPGYYEIGLEIGVELNYELITTFAKFFKISLTESEKWSLVGVYGYIDCILGFDEDEWNWFSFAKKEIVAAAMSIIMSKYIHSIIDGDLSWDDNSQQLEPVNDLGKNLLGTFSSPVILTESIDKFAFPKGGEMPIVKIW